MSMRQNCGHAFADLARRELECFGNVRAIDARSSTSAGEIHGLDRPHGKGKTTTLNVISGYYGCRNPEP